MTTTYDELLSYMLSQYDTLMAKGRKTMFISTADISPETATTIKSYFEEKLKCTVEIKMCPRKKWDIIVTF